VFVDEQYLEEIKSRIDLVKFIAQYVDLKPAGRNFRALCPFHEEKTPSFIVSPEKGVFHCFGCGVGGNIFTFVMKMENISFSEAVRFLAEKCGLTLRPFSKGRGETKAWGEKERLFRLNEALSRYYMRCLHEEREGEAISARKYLWEKRKIHPKTWERFALGLSPSSGKSSIAFLLQEGFSGQEIMKAGVGVVTKTGELLDRFRGRIVFPFRDLQGRVIGFAGRVWGEGEPKYLNVSETPLFSKSHYLYDLFATREYLQKSHQAILVEGYLDLLALFDNGIYNGVASMGTALTKDQAALLRRYVEEVCICYDADRAGQMATLRGMTVLQEKGLTVKIVTLPSPHDPDSFLREEGKEKFFTYLEKSRSLFEYQLELLIRDYGCNSLETKARIIRGMYPLIVTIKDPIEKTLKIASLAQKIGVDESFVHRLFSEEGSFSPKGVTPAAQTVEDGIAKAEKIILRMIMENRNWRAKIEKELGDEHFSRREHQRIFQAVLHLGKNRDFLISELIDLFPNEESLPSLITEIVTREDLKEACREDALSDLLRRVKLAALDRKIVSLRKELSRCEDPGKLGELNKLCVEREKLKRVE